MLGPQSGIPSAANAAGAGAPGLTDAPAKGSVWGADGFTFGDLVDIVNPLQHIPVVSWAYRALTGDQIAPAAKMAGGALFGGAAGFALSAADTVLEGVTGRDAGTTAVAMLSGHEREMVEIGRAHV